MTCQHRSGRDPGFPRRVTILLTTRRHLDLSVIVLSALLLGAACDQGIAFSSSTGESTITGMGSMLCPVDWSGTALDEAFLQRFDATLAAGFQNLAVEVDAEIQRRNTSIIRRIELQHLTFRMPRIPDPAGNQNTFGFVREIRLYVEPSRADSRLQRQHLGTSQTITDAATSISFEMESVDLEPYFDEGFVISSEVEPRTCLRDDVTFVIDFTARFFL